MDLPKSEYDREEMRKTHYVKRITFGDKACDKFKDRLRAISNVHRCVAENVNARIRFAYTQYEVEVDQIKFVMFDEYESYAPSQIYVAMANKKDYENLKKAIG